MSSDPPKQPSDNQGTPLHRPYPTYANHVNDLIRGPLFSQDNCCARSSVMPSDDSARSEASASAYRDALKRALPTLAEADERRRRLIEANSKRWPTEKMRIPPEIRPKGVPRVEGSQGFFPELEGIIAAKQEQTKHYKEFYVEWTDLQTKLHEKSEDLRTKYASLVEQVRGCHHKFVNHRMNKRDYNSARKTLADQMDDIFEKLGKIAITMGTMYAESRAVAQGANPTGDFDYGKLDISACTAVPFLNHHFSDFVKKKDSSTPPDPFGPGPHDFAFKTGLPSYDFADMMATVWSTHPTKLQEIHEAVFDKNFDGIKELTRKEKDNVNALLGNGGEWSI
ncbi:hypothetical protein N0V82_000192 [Gnomoniopsis sp. IMI 355080]|nr:hypothetical protein N0V82_000192 [Gnomoniopsis sp. IMI 355080]